ncbi:Prephenate dehydratase [Meredithblackwellia eburnea MCA 4105]
MPRPRVSFLGPLGTYSHQATSDFFGDNVDLVPVPTIADVFASVTSSSTSYGLVPIENSSIGPVTETMDLLRTTTDAVVRNMVALKIGHAVMGLPGLEQGDKVRKVYSHEQGIGQCVDYLAKHYPGAEVVPTTSTARAAELARDDPTALAICSIKCAEVYGLKVYGRDVQDGGASNTTRFVIISQPSIPLAREYPVEPWTVNGTRPKP